jgi:hypothetical protein
MSRVSKVQDGHLIVPLWLIFDRGGNVRLTRTNPDCARNERAMQMVVKVPMALFQTPTISATVTIEAPTTAFPEINLTAAADALKGAVGCDVDVRLVEQENGA